LRRKLITTPLGIVGLVFTVVGLPFVVVFPLVAVGVGEPVFLCVGSSLGVGFIGLGLAFLAVAIRGAYRAIRAYRLGQATLGSVVDVHRDLSVTVNGRNPWAVEYEFDVLGTPYRGRVLTWSRAAGERRPGQPVHVLYLPDNPNDNLLYPPMR